MHGHRITNETQSISASAPRTDSRSAVKVLHEIAAKYEKLRLCVGRKMTKILNEFRNTKPRFGLCC